MKWGGEVTKGMLGAEKMKRRKKCREPHLQRIN